MGNLCRSTNQIRRPADQQERPDYSTNQFEDANIPTYVFPLMNPDNLFLPSRDPEPKIITSADFLHGDTFS